MQLAESARVPWVRLVLAVSLDGRLTPPHGGAAQLGRDGDRRVLEQALAWADACLIGAGTLRAHECTCLIRDQMLVQQRLQKGRPAQPAAVVVSHSSAFPKSWRFFQQPMERWLLSPSASDQSFDRWFPLGKTWADRLLSLADAGAKQLVLLGGGGLVTDLLREDAVDELQLTFVPAVLGGNHSWVLPIAGDLPMELAKPGSWLLTNAEPLGGAELLVRYRRQRG